MSKGRVEPSFFKDVIAVASGGYHIVALRRDGTVVMTDDSKKIFSLKTKKGMDWQNMIAIAAGMHHVVGQRNDGRMEVFNAAGWEDNKGLRISRWDEIKAFTVGFDFTAGLKTDGTMVMTPVSYYMNLFVTERWNDVAAIAAEWTWIMGLKSDGYTLYAYGEKTCKHVPDYAEGLYQGCKRSLLGKKTIMNEEKYKLTAIAAGQEHAVGLRANGTVVALGNNGMGQCDVEDWEGIVAIAAGSGHTMGLRYDGRVLFSGTLNVKENVQTHYKDEMGVKDPMETLPDDWELNMATDQRTDSLLQKNWNPHDVREWQDIVAISSRQNEAVGLCRDGTIVAAGRIKFPRKNLGS